MPKTTIKDGKRCRIRNQDVKSLTKLLKSTLITTPLPATFSAAIDAAVADEDDATVRVAANDEEDYGSDVENLAGQRSSDLAVFLADITVSYESQPYILLMLLADYFGRAFASVNTSQFPWTKTLSVFSNFKNSILTDLALHQGASKGSKKVVQQPTSKSQVAIFVVLAMVLRRKPDVMIGILPTLKDTFKYQGLEKLPVLLWTITQACQGDLVVGLFLWVQLLLPLVCSKSGCNPQSRDLILQLVERILSFPKARTILVNGAVRKGERVVPPSSLELLMGPTFPAPTAHVKATDRFEAIYPILTEVSLAVAPGSKAMKQLTQQLLPIAAKAAGQGNSALASEASNIFLWCLTQSPDCYKQWDDIYLDHLEASLVVLRKLSDECKIHSVKLFSLDPLKSALKSFRVKNEKAMAGGDDREALLNDADKHCKIILGKFSRGDGCLKATVFLTVTMAVGVVVIIKDHWNLKELVDIDLSRAFTSFSH
ncbi:hypothetical protein L1987_65550 [Smallanthus sonchifolius]|uniref:Uncharacterized protein n=1 Tax=Smallanthus sonchifolius TaxID=185202 RepID=A0ACB9BUP8_9ASTR|nr:hypothetical protein L1987_65550 [Smallanthus sonchifolius]